MIPAYNCGEFLGEAIESVLRQDPGEEYMQIEVVDDASTDIDVAALVLEIGKGRVKYFRQDVNTGSLRNFETAINRATGHYIHLLHGDDRVKPGFYAHIERLFEQFPEAAASFSCWDYINGNGALIKKESARAASPGIIENCLHKLSRGQMIQYVSMVVKRNVYEELGSFYGVFYGEDWEMWARIAKHHPIAYTPESLAEYRTHYNSITGHSFLNGNNIRDLRKVFKAIGQMLPEEDRKQASLAVRRNYAIWALEATRFMWQRTGNHLFVYRQLFELLKLYPNLQLFFRSVALLLRIWKVTLRKKLGKLKRKLIG
ncbi:glycosyltransferase [Flavihumibacter fluvii]|nr:glycosyltransferase [Flavihumibacter fluvii]ULQ52431.1 glycosyltransferase [Flavihumibacter fluvii]